MNTKNIIDYLERPKDHAIFKRKGNLFYSTSLEGFDMLNFDPKGYLLGTLLSHGYTIRDKEEVNDIKDLHEEWVHWKKWADRFNSQGLRQGGSLKAFRLRYPGCHTFEASGVGRGAFCLNCTKIKGVHYKSY
jgi:hypothetical protein